jgi:hypothetical protein
MAKDYLQVECFNFDKTFTHVARLESIRILLAYATHHDFKLYQMDVKSTFLNGSIKEEIYVEQSPGFKSKEYHNYVYRLHKALYRLKEAPRACINALGIFSLTMVLEHIWYIMHEY